MGPARTALAAAAVTAVMAALPQVAEAAGPITRGMTPVSSRTLRTGVTLSQYSMQVSDHGALRRVKVWKIWWKVGNPHVRLDAALLGAYNADDSSVRLTPISSWARRIASPSLVAAMNGDFFADSWLNAGSGKPSGLLIHDRRVYGFGWVGPAAGLKPGGDIVFGRPQAVPATLTLPAARR
jgi:hypothetical protein